MNKARVIGIVSTVLLLFGTFATTGLARASVDPPCPTVGDEQQDVSVSDCVDAGVGVMTVTANVVTIVGQLRTSQPLTCELSLHEHAHRHRSRVKGNTVVRDDVHFPAEIDCGVPPALNLAISGNKATTGTLTFNGTVSSCTLCQAPPPSVGTASCTNCTGSWQHAAHFTITSPLGSFTAVSFSPAPGTPGVSWSCTQSALSLDCDGSDTFIG